MPIEKPVRMADNTYYFAGDLWTAKELHERWGIEADGQKSEAHSQACSGFRSAAKASH